MSDNGLPSDAYRFLRDLPSTLEKDSHGYIKGYNYRIVLKDAASTIKQVFRPEHFEVGDGLRDLLTGEEAEVLEVVEVLYLK